MKLIAAMTKDYVIGKDGSLPWYIKEDLKLFKELTKGNTVLMGRKTFDSIVDRLNKPLPQRQNIVISKHPMSYKAENLYACRNISDAVEKAESFGTDVFVIGGASLYKQTLPLVDEMHISWVKQYYKGDTFFPKFDEKDWNIVDAKEYEEFTWMHYQRNKS
ncbi:dihydrofolate reductase [Nanoarchaeota archaeon]